MLSSRDRPTSALIGALILRVFNPARAALVAGEAAYRSHGAIIVVVMVIVNRGEGPTPPTKM